MKNKKMILFLIIIIFFISSFFPSLNAIGDIKQVKNEYIENIDPIIDGTEYWALLVAVGVYADNPEEDRPLMLEEVDDLYECMLDSSIWSEDHIKVIKGEEATTTNIIKGLRWLDRMEDNDDISVVFITTHGFPLDFDIPPADEEDGFDEALVSYWGFAFENLFIWDDQLNFLLNRLESQGVCLIVDSCFAGGFNDPPDWNITILQNNPYFYIQKQKSIKNWIEGFGKEMKSQGRVVLMASCEDEVSYSGGFAPYLIDGLRGFGDSNMDGIVTAEEAFYYTQPRTFRQNPTIYDGYEGELPLIYLNDYSINIQKEEISFVDDIIHNQILIDKSQDETSVVQGYILDSQTSDPIENADVSIRGRIGGWEFYENETITDIYGYYHMNIPEGRFRLSSYANGYLSTESNQFEIDDYETRWINLSLAPRPEETAIVYGYITDSESSEPIENVTVDIIWYQGQNQYYRNETSTDIMGYYSMNIAPGFFNIDFEANGYFRESIDEIYIGDEEVMEIDVEMIPRPQENAIVSGYIIDKETSEPISNARMELLWVDIELDHSYENQTFTDLDGFYEMNIAGGEVYHDIRKDGYNYYKPYRLDIVEYETLWLDVELEKEIFDIEIEKPLNAIYNKNERFIPFPKSIVFGPINITIGLYDSHFWGGDADYVEIYIDDELVVTLDNKPYTYLWDDFSIGKHIIKAIGYDYQGNYVSTQRKVFKLF